MRSIWTLCVAVGLGLTVLTAGGCNTTAPRATLLSNGSAAEGLRSIREDFQIMPRPLILAYNTPRDEVVSATPPPGSHEVELVRVSHIELTQQAKNFIARHSGVELITALYPLLESDASSADAYTILAMVTNSQVAGGYLHESGYRSAQQPGAWSRIRDKAVLELKQHLDEVLFSPETPEELSAATLGDEIRRIQSDIAGLREPVVSQFLVHAPRNYSPATTGPDAAQPASEPGYSEAVLSPSAAVLLAKYSKYDLIAATAPLIYSNIASERAVVILAKLLNAEPQLGNALESYHSNLESEGVRQKLDDLSRDYLLQNAPLRD